MKDSTYIRQQFKKDVHTYFYHPDVEKQLFEATHEEDIPSYIEPTKSPILPEHQGFYLTGTLYEIFNGEHYLHFIDPKKVPQSQIETEILNIGGYDDRADMILLYLIKEHGLQHLLAENIGKYIEVLKHEKNYNQIPTWIHSEPVILNAQDKKGNTLAHTCPEKSPWKFFTPENIKLKNNNQQTPIQKYAITRSLKDLIETIPTHLFDPQLLIDDKNLPINYAGDLTVISPKKLTRYSVSQLQETKEVLQLHRIMPLKFNQSVKTALEWKIQMEKQKEKLQEVMTDLPEVQ
jgi:hypothetical protein